MGETWRGHDPTNLRVIAIDVMDTLLSDPYRRAHEVATGLSFSDFEAIRPEGVYYAFERGEISEQRYWSALRQAGISVDVDRFHHTRLNGYRWLPGMRSLVLELVVSSRVILASNYPESWFCDIQEFLPKHVESAVSGRLGARKPSAEFFSRMCQRFGFEADEMLFIDNSPRNVETAVQMGGRGHHFVSASRARRELESWGLIGPSDV